MENLAMTPRQKFWRNRHTFVTGATGLVGSWLVRALDELGADVVALIRDWTPQSALMCDGTIERINVVRGDLCDQTLLERIVGEYETVTVFHLAAQTIVPIANRNPLSTFETNVAGTWRLLEACRRSPMIQQIVIASSDKAYGHAETLPYREDTPLRGRHPYDVSKSCADLIAQTYASTWNVPVVVTRCGNFFGGGDINWSRVVPGTIRSLMMGEPPVIRSDGTPVRDYIYIEDAVNAYLLLAEKMANNSSLAGQAFNFSTESPLSVLDMVKRICVLMGSAETPLVLNESANEIAQQFLDAEKARRMLSWRPTFGLDEGLKRTIAWYRAHLNEVRQTGAWSTKRVQQ